MCHLSPWNCVGISHQVLKCVSKGTLTKHHEEWCAFNCVSSICLDLVKQLVIFHLFSIVLVFFCFFVLCRRFESDFWNPNSCFKINFSKFEVNQQLTRSVFFFCIEFWPFWMEIQSWWTDSFNWLSHFSLVPGKNRESSVELGWGKQLVNTSTKDKAYFAHCEKCWHLKPRNYLLGGIC